MASQAKINANRLNSQKSTGPTSTQGKAASSLNALKSGIHANSHIIPGEDPAGLEALTAEFLLHFHPTDPNQRSLVDTLIAAEWTQRRLRRIEAQLWHTRDNPTRAEISDSPDPAQFEPLGHSCPDALDPFIRIQRRIDGTNRMYLRTLQVLQDLQQAPVEQASACHVGIHADTSSKKTQPLASPNGFVPPIASVSGKTAHQKHPVLETGSRAQPDQAPLLQSPA